ncbi:MAG: RNA polymerase factor sigma-54 [Silvanigrellaceae bacterium]|nr:RNA polymerase factor sigma-54 [Silvanigrellaceae bacterium]
MGLETSQNQKSEQKIRLYAQLKQSIQILQYDQIQLENFLKEKIKNNPFLHYRKKTNPFEHDIPDESKNNLYDEFQSQIQLMNLTSFEKKCCKIILEYIDENGFLSNSLKEISKETGILLNDLNSAFRFILKCEPSGIGARSYQERFLYQLNSIKNAPKIGIKIIKYHWDSFLNFEIQKIAQKEKLTYKEVEQAFLFIKKNLDPKPTRNFNQKNHSYIIPDIYVLKDSHQEFFVTINKEELPNVKISRYYTKILKNFLDIKENIITTKDSETIKYLKYNYHQACHILKALDLREKTILKTTKCIVLFQKDFFANRSNVCVPMKLKDVAEKLNFHESTISRAIAGKYLSCEQGIFSLKYFFQNSLIMHNGEKTSPQEIKNWIKRIIFEENDPLSDLELTKMINAKLKVTIARRTITKYRESLGIENSTKRKKQLTKKNEIHRFNK